MTFRLILDECRERFGAAPRTLSEADHAAFRFEIPFSKKLSFWMGHPLAKLQGESRVLAERGRIVWGYVVAAEDKLRSTAKGPSQTAIVLYGLGEDLDDRPDLLERVGDQLATARNEPDVAADLSLARPPVAKSQSAERSEGASLLLSGTLITPSSLPLDRLERNLLPLLVAPDKTKHVLPLPKRWWSEALIAYWTERPE
ncbi:MAG TPA: hypothetical protein VGN57_10930 [Pirellulaceae bacterium]|jgi:hypothetical protein|nr:hypothetical protein [Pirellulaceae bacterium]